MKCTSCQFFVKVCPQPVGGVIAAVARSGVPPYNNHWLFIASALRRSPQ